MRRRSRRQNPNKQFLILAAAAGIGAAFLFSRKTPSSVSSTSLLGTKGSSPSTPPGPVGSPSRSFALRNFIPIKGGDPAFAVPIGTSTALLNRVGCLIGSVTMAVNFLYNKNLTPLDANEVGKKTSGAFIGANTNATILGGAMNVDVPYKFQMRGSPPQDFKKRIEDTLKNSGVCILHVDYDSEQPGGDPNGDHFIVLLDQQGVDPKAREAVERSSVELTAALAKTSTPEGRASLQSEIDRLKSQLAMPGGAFVCADPASGKFRLLNPQTLQGPGIGKQTYSVVAVMPVFRKGETPASLA